MCKQVYCRERGLNFRGGLSQQGHRRLCTLGEGEGSRNNLVTCPVKDKHWLHGLWPCLTSRRMAVAFGSSGPWLSRCLLSCESQQVKQSLPCPVHCIAEAADPWAFILQWVKFWPAETNKWATLQNRGCVSLAKKLRMLSARPGAPR